MSDTGTEEATEALLTEKVRARVGIPADEANNLHWHSFEQMFGSTCGPWPGFGGAAMTTIPITIATLKQSGQVLVFVASDLFAFGTGDMWFWGQVRRGEIDFGRLADYGLTVLDRPLS